MEAAIGVIGLSLQLIDSAVKVKRAIGNYRSASTEIHRLSLKIERVEAICGAIKKSLEGDPSTRQCSDLIETWGVCVLRSVQSTLAELQDIIAKLEKKAAKKRIVNAARMAFLEKDDITRLSRCLDEDLNHLQHMMMTEIFSQCNIVQRLIVHQSSPQTASSTEDQATSLTCSESYTTATAQPSVTKIVTESNRKVISALGLYGQAQSVKILKRSRWQNNRETTTSKETKTYNFGLSGISYRVEFHWQLSMACPVVYAMNFRHVISTNSRLSKEVRDVICIGDLQALQSMLSAGMFTLSSLVGKRTLFEMAAITRQPIICRFLAQQDARLCLDEQLCRPDVSSGYKWLSLEPFEIRRRVFEIDDIVQQTQVSRASRFRLIAFRLEDVQSLIALYHRCNGPALDPTEKEDFINAAWDAAVLLLTYHNTEDNPSFPDDQLMEIWTVFFVDLIKEGVDVHRLISRSPHLSEVKKESYHTALYTILTAYLCHRDVEAILSRWLRILKNSQIDMHGYICHETAFCRHSWRTFRYGWARTLSTKKIEGFEVPFWRRFVDPLSKAYDVRHEFRNWGCLYLDEGSLKRVQFQENPEKLATKDYRQHTAMKRPDLVLEDPRWVVAMQDDWPFEVSLVRTFDLNSLPLFGLSVKEQSNIERSCLYARELMQSRFDRRQMRKLYKSGYLKRERETLRVPGAWPISEW